MSHYTQILERLLRLRQLCCHPSLLPASRETQEEEGGEGGGLGKEEAGDLAGVLETRLASGDEECCVCLDSIVAPVITRCK